ncbi:MAG: YicC family protein [Bacteroidales bacterium]|nr:YicC family protein [Bacteroidales bacterium]
MIKSMTGFGKSVAETGSKSVTLEIRSLNSKQLDLNVRIPQVYRDKEFEIRAEISKVLERGKVDFTITLDSDADSSLSGINKSLARQYHREILELAEELKTPVGDDLITSILKMPDVLKTEKVSLDESEWLLVKAALADCLKQADLFRKEEGKLLGNDMVMRIRTILSLLEAVTPFEKSRIQSLRERFERNQSEFVAGRPGLDKFDENRFEQEIFWYLERLDITEEKIRLKKHCDYFIETLNSEESNGRKLGFVTQEIGREINTLGSKASDAEIQKIVVQMKDELEKIKEQLGNIL